MGLETYWYQKRLHPLLIPLLPFSKTFGLLLRLRRWLYHKGFRKTRHFSIPIVIVGNISVGGTGKTPLVIALANELKQQGFHPGIALRGVGGQLSSTPQLIHAQSNPFKAGDEAVLIAKNTGCPVATCKDRPAAVAVLERTGCNLILCDDGLQHYRLARTIEIAVIDGSRYFGNGRLLPAGPLREPPSRLREVDFILVNEGDTSSRASEGGVAIQTTPPSFAMYLKANHFQAVHQTDKKLALTAFQGQKVHAVAGIGNPQRFFDGLTRLGIDFIPHCFPDHYAYLSADLAFSDELPVVMTEKDAVKCQNLPFTEQAREKQWYLQVEPELSPQFKKALLESLKQAVMPAYS